MMGLSALSRLAKENGHQHFQRDCNASKNIGKQTFDKGNQSKSWSMSEPSISGKGQSKGTKSENKGVKGSCKSKTSETGISGLENKKSETCSGNQELVQMRQVYTSGTSWIHEE